MSWWESQGGRPVLQNQHRSTQLLSRFKYTPYALRILLTSFVFRLPVIGCSCWGKLQSDDWDLTLLNIVMDLYNTVCWQLRWIRRNLPLLKSEWWPSNRTGHPQSFSTLCIYCSPEFSETVLMRIPPVLIHMNCGSGYKHTKKPAEIVPIIVINNYTYLLR